MSDEALRALERAFQAAPGPETRAAFASALLRAGDRRRAFALLAAGARTGCAEAARALEAWHPWPAPDGPGGRRASVAGVASPRGERARAGLPLGLGAVLGATTRALVVLGFTGRGGEVAALDLETLATRWSLDAGPAPVAALVGEDVVVIAVGRLAVHDVATGERRGGLTLPAGAAWVAGAGDRAVVLLNEARRAPFGLCCVDLARPAAPLVAWRRDVAGVDGPLVVSGDRVQARAVCLRLADGQPAPLLEPWPSRRPYGAACLRLPAGELVAHIARVPRGPGRYDHELVATLEQPGPSPADLAGGDAPIAWRQPLPAWASTRGARHALVAAGDEILALLCSEGRVALLAFGAADGAPRGEVPLTLSGRGLWDHRQPAPCRLLAVDGAAFALVPARQVGFFQVARIGADAAPATLGASDAAGDAAGDAASAARPLRPLPGAPTAVVGRRERFVLEPSVWRTADGLGVLAPASVDYAHLWEGGGQVWPVSRTAALVVPAVEVVLLEEPEPRLARVALLVDLETGGVVALPLSARVRALAGAPGGLVLAEGDYTRPGDFHAGGFQGCRVSGWEVPSGARAFALALGPALPKTLEAAADGRLALEVEVEDDATDDLVAERREVDPGVPGFADLAPAPPGPTLALDWPEPAACGRLRGTPVVLAEALPPAPPLGACAGEVAATWEDARVVAVTRDGREVARLAFPPDVRPGSVRSARTPPPRGRGPEPPGSVRYVLRPPALLALTTDGSHVLAVTTPKDAPDPLWVAVLWSLATPEAPLGQVVLGPARLPPPRAVLPAPPGRLHLDLGRGAALEAALEGALAALVWAPGG